MGMSISERMAMQARAAAASHVKPIAPAKQAATVSVASRAAKQANVAKADSNHAGNGAPPEARKPVATMSAAQRIARQGTVARQNSDTASRVPPPAEAKPTASMSAAERIQKQAITASAQKRGNIKTEVTQELLDKIRAEYKVFAKGLLEELEKEGPLFFVAGNVGAKPKPAVAEAANGVSTAEGEMVIEAKPSEPVPGMPFQATPVITPAPKRRGRKTKREAASA